ncbi:hypothetical protein [Sphingopyxis sp. 113P3]|uniref:hypothetical protein n=1 Tax=Sphingopyxis sp. (strain 113P3) TaxID=292913 RepID=UPI0006AD46FA|nr:hypothetical protein [Sphingopyxis sp. 113P3]ALC13847.1 hypothetical protein LH20_17965 [Sphingopyxis sp. 113P3]
MAVNDENGGKRPRAKLTDEVIRIILERLKMGHFQHDIAADLGINQGRVSEVNTGKRGGGQFRQGSLF